MSNDVMREWQEFGSRMQVVAILSVLTFVIPFFGLLELIFIFMALGNIRNIYYKNPDPNLMEFRSKYIISFVVSLLGIFVIISGALGLVLTLFGISSRFSNFNFSRGWAFIIVPFVVVILIGILILFIAGYLEYKAWGKLMVYFENNLSLFPERLGRDAINGAKNLKLGTVLSMTVILSFVGIIFQIIGYFKLASLKRLNDDYNRTPSAQPLVMQPMVQAPIQQAVQPPPKTIVSKFCPQCGNRFYGRDASFCSQCGNSIKS